MSKMRIYELAKQLGVANKELMEKMKSVGMEANSHMSMIEESDADKIRKLYQPAQKAEEPKKEAPKQEAKEQHKGNRQKEAPKQDNRNKGENKKAQDGKNPQNNNQNKNNQNKNQNNNTQNNQNQGKKDKKGKGKKDQKPRENPLERRRREMEEEAALLAELEALEAAEKAAEPVIKSIPASISVKELAEVLGKKGSDLVMALMKKGQMLNINATLDFDTAAAIAEDYNVILEQEEEKDILETVFAEEEDDEKDLKERPPVVVVMGHVDHGKTSLLDAIRHSNVTKGEAGGITQHIGAYTVQIDGKPITFLDTPGHEAFTAMRMRGAQITDIAILVVAADDGVMPQTVEAINHAKAAGVEIIVAINKMDKPSANPDRVKQELVEYGLVAEDWGGQTICVPVSAVTKEGLDSLLEMIILVAEMKELKANPNKHARGAIVEAQLDKGRGPVATVLVQNGTLQVGDPIVAGAAYGKIRAMTDDKGRRVKKAGPSTPVEILGLSEVPSAGDSFYVAENDKQARQVAESIIAKNRENMIKETPQKVSLDDLFSQIQSGNMKELNIVVKADVQGSVEAVRQSLERLSNEEVRVRIIHGGVGAITESDVMLASASNAIIIGFNVRPEPAAKAFADEEKVDVRLYRVIYNAIEDITAAMKGLLDPVFEEQVLGHAEVRQLFKASGVGTIAGSYVKDGKFVRNCQVRIIRDGIVVYEGDLESLKRFKDDVKEVAAGYECGLVFKKFNDVKEGDWIEAYTMVEVPR
ncbi:translation initiation factor IF-2 [Anaerotignum lactatifermentans]|uniref:translation initiation factor IF-2 n=1 Tax=Anaerotignum lactatifermentans TaxID=160404 RepID=UPI00255D1572|nr:translation initiation factor IF-2 [Anaerotignum lactatifermentans]